MQSRQYGRKPNARDRINASRSSGVHPEPSVPRWNPIEWEASSSSSVESSNAPVRANDPVHERVVLPRRNAPSQASKSYDARPASRSSFSGEQFNPSKFYIGTFWPKSRESRASSGGKTTIHSLARAIERAKGGVERKEEKTGQVDGVPEEDEGGISRAIANAELVLSQFDEPDNLFDDLFGNRTVPRNDEPLEEKAAIPDQPDNGDGSDDEKDGNDGSCPFELDDTHINYLVGQWEQGDSSDKLNRLHFQFFVEFKQKIRVNQARRYLVVKSDGKSFSGWLEPARSQKAEEYCQKERSRVGNVFKFGVKGGKEGQNGKIEKIHELMKAGNSALEISAMFPDLYVRFSNAIHKWETYYDRPRDSEIIPKVEIYYGVTGSGKSYKAFQEHPNAYRKMQGRWWDGYKGEKVVIIEDFRPPSPDEWKSSEVKSISLDEWLRILDRYPMKIEYKGGSRQLQANHFIFTSNFPPNEWFVGHTQFPAFCRRVSRILHFPFRLDDLRLIGQDRALALEESISFRNSGLIVEDISGLTPADEF